MDEFVICVFGSGGVGKSCLTMQFVKNVFLPKYDPTIEDVYKTTIEVDERKYSLEIFDTAGSEEFSSMRDLYVKTGHGFVLVYSITSQATFDNIGSYYDRIMAVKDIEATGRPPLILVGNKTDLEAERVISRETGQALANKWKCSFLETSAKSRANVTEVFHDLVRQIKHRAPVKRIVDGRVTYSEQTGEGVAFEDNRSPKHPSTPPSTKKAKCKCCTVL